MGHRALWLLNDKQPLPSIRVPLQLEALGAILIFFGFFGFNGGSIGGITTDVHAAAYGLAVTNTIIAGAFGGMTSLMVRYVALYAGGKSTSLSVISTINGALTGMVRPFFVCLFQILDPTNGDRPDSYEMFPCIISDLTWEFHENSFLHFPLYRWKTQPTYWILPIVPCIMSVLSWQLAPAPNLGM